MWGQPVDLILGNIGYTRKEDGGCVYKCPTCQGNSLTSVWTPPTMRVLLLATPQLQVLGTMAGEEVVTAGTPVAVVGVVGMVGAEYEQLCRGLKNY